MRVRYLLGALISVMQLLPIFGGAARAVDMSGSQPLPGEEANYWQYFYFWKAGADPVTARADIVECSTYAHDPVLWARVPERMPLQGGVSGPSGTEGPFGLAGAIGYWMVEGGLVRRITLANTRRCMGFKGYRRYGLSVAGWQTLYNNGAEPAIERLVAVATGPEPKRPSIAP